MGYNVGGIVGRQSGYLDGCRNTGTVRGRKDVGGIAGQLEPQVTLRYDEDTLARLGTELDTLQSLVDQAVSHAGTSSDEVFDSLDELHAEITAAKDAAHALGGALTDWGNENLEEINDASARLAWVIDRSEGVLNSMTDAAASLEDGSVRLARAAKKAEEAGDLGAEASVHLQQATQELDGASELWESASAHFSSAIQLAQEALYGEGDATLQDVLSELNAAGEDAEKAKDSLDKAVEHTDTAIEELETIGEPVGEALEELTPASQYLHTALSSLEDASSQLADIAATLSEEPAISFTPVGSGVTGQADALDAALSQMLDTAAQLQDTASASSDTLLDDLSAINAQAGVIADLLEQGAQDVKESDAAGSFEDASDQEEGESESGRISGSENSGEVLGDVNVAGIAGSLSVELDFDPEDDLTKDGTRSLDYQFRTVAVVEDCVNRGAVSAKKDHAGGVVGRMDLGAVRACESYGSVESTGGDCVGGIAGYSAATIRDCFVKCSLSGGDYMGGVLGAGGEDSVTSGCCSLVAVTQAGRCFGAIAGTETGEYSGNRYVSDTLAGLGGSAMPERRSRSPSPSWSSSAACPMR